MMSCEQLQRFVDGAPLETRSERDMAVAREHAAGCAGCATILRQAKNLERALASMTIAPPEGLADEVMRRVQAESQARAEAPDTLPQARIADVSRREKLGWAAAIAGNLALAGAYLYRFDAWAGLTELLAPNTGMRGGSIPSWVTPDAALLVVTAGVVLLAAGILALPGDGDRRPVTTSR